MGRPAAGQLTDGWQMVEFGDVVRQAKADADPETSGLERYVAGEHMNTDDLHLRSWGTIGEGYLGPAFHRKFVKGQVLYGSRRTYLRKVAVADFDGICANTTFVLEPKDERLIPELLPFVMQTDAFNEHAVKQSRGSVNPYVNFRDIAWYTFPLPPKEEQRRIADILWAADAAVERWREVRAHAAAAQGALRATVFDRSVSPSVPLAEAGSWISGGTPSRSRRDYWAGDIPWVSPKDMKTDILFDAQEHISKEASSNGTRMVEAEAIFIVVRGMILAHTFPVAMTGRNMAFNQDMKALIVAGDFRPQFVLEWLKHMAGRILKLTSESTHGTKRLSSDAIFGLQIPKPDPVEQDKMLSQLRAAQEAVAACERQIGTTTTTARMLRGELLEGRGV